MNNKLHILYSPKMTTDCDDVCNPPSTFSCYINDELEDSVHLCGVDYVKPIVYFSNVSDLSSKVNTV